MVNKIILKAYFLFFVFSMSTVSVSGCRCDPPHPQKIFCSRDFVFVGEVLKRTFIPRPPPDPNNNEAVIEYDLRVINNMKGNICNVRQKARITSAGNSGLCRVDLDVGSKLLITVFKSKRIGPCDLLLPTSSLTFEQMVYYFSNGRFSYKRNCGCQGKHFTVHI